MNAPHSIQHCRIEPKQRIIIGILMLGTLRVGSIDAMIVIVAFSTGPG